VLIVLIVLQKRISLKFPLKFDNALRITNTRFDAALGNLPQRHLHVRRTEAASGWNLTLGALS